MCPLSLQPPAHPQHHGVPHGHHPHQRPPAPHPALRPQLLLAALCCPDPLQCRSGKWRGSRRRETGSSGPQSCQSSAASVHSAHWGLPDESAARKRWVSSPCSEQCFLQVSEMPVVTGLKVSKGKGKLLCTSLRITVYVESKCRTSVVRGRWNMENRVLEKTNFMLT